MNSRYAGFENVLLKKPQRSQFDLSHYKRSSTRMGRLTPVFITECVPSDTFRGSSEILVRVAPLLAPIYDNLIMYVHYFFVPNRLLWEDWEEFITGGRLGVEADPASAPIPPYWTIEGLLSNVGQNMSKSGLMDYLGVPIFEDLPGYVNPAQYAGIKLDAMPALSYQKVYMDWYRDRNFVPDNLIEFPVPAGEMADYEATELRLRSYMHDYFTSALPFTQRGTEVLMPLAGSGSVTYLESSNWYQASGANADPGAPNLASVLPGPLTKMRDDTNEPLRVENIDEVNLETSSVSINDFRSAYALQVWYERNAIAGSRYNESSQAHFGVRPQDQRLQRSEYIGGGRVQIKISEIVSNAYSQNGEVVFPLANLAGHGIGYGTTNRFNYFCAEHGFIIGIASIMNPPSYDGGLPRMFRRRSFLDYPWPTFAKLGEQQVDKSELFASAANLTEDSAGLLPLFGYQSRYADWKWIASTNHGDFHDTLLFWTLTRVFESSPTLGQSFVEFDTTTQERIFAVNNEDDNFWLYISNMVTVVRPLPYFGTPNTLGFN